MSKLSVLLLFALFAFTFQARLKKGAKCADLGQDCDAMEYCCMDYVCKDYRCAQKGTEDNQIPWAPEGPKCDWGHHCKDGFHCMSHRCYSDEEVKVAEEKALKENEKVLAEKNKEKNEATDMTLIPKLYEIRKKES